jgi:hypothetical protein
MTDFIYDEVTESFRIFKVKKDGKYGYVDYKGKEVLPCSYEYADETFDASTGTANVYQNGKFGVIDYNGNEIIPCIYDKRIRFAEGIALVEKDGMEFYIDNKGKYVLSYMHAPFDTGVRTTMIRNWY